MICLFNLWLTSLTSIGLVSTAWVSLRISGNMSRSSGQLWLDSNMQLGTVVYDVVVGLVMANHGGEHVWDISHSQAKDALYVCTLPACKYANVDGQRWADKVHIVVQHRIGRIRFHHPPHKVVGIITLPTSLLARAMESIWLYYRRPNRHHDFLLHQHMHCENHAMHPSIQDLG